MVVAVHLHGRRAEFDYRPSGRLLDILQLLRADAGIRKLVTVPNISYPSQASSISMLCNP
jgi:hypothetical protein